MEYCENYKKGLTKESSLNNKVIFCETPSCPYNNKTLIDFEGEGCYICRTQGRIPTEKDLTKKL